MNEIFEIVNIVLPVFFIIGIGYSLGAVGFVSAQANSFLSRIVFYVAAPALLFRSAQQSSLSQSIGPRGLLVVAGVSVALAFGVYFLSGAAGPARRGVLAQGASRSNMVFVGLPVVVNAFGEDALGPAAVLIGFMVVVYNLLAVLLLTMPHNGRGQSLGAVWGRTCLEVVKNPLIVASGSGIVFSALGIGLPISIDRSFEMVGRIAMPLALLSVGAGLDFGRLRNGLGLSAAMCAIKLIVYPGLICASLALCGITGVELKSTVLIIAAPTAVVSCIMAREMKGDEQLAAAIVIGTTVASLFTISGWLAFFRFGF